MDEKLRFVAFSRATGMDGLQIAHSAKRKEKLDEPAAKRQKAECSIVNEAEVVQSHGCSIVNGPVNAFEIEAPPVQSQAMEDEPMDLFGNCSHPQNHQNPEHRRGHSCPSQALN